MQNIHIGCLMNRLTNADYLSPQHLTIAMIFIYINNHAYTFQSDGGHHID